MYISARACGGVIVVIGIVVLSSSWLSAQDLGGNPDRGEAIYKEQCLRCHGRLGDGNGPDAGDLIVRPSDFHTARSREKSDFELLVAISNGVLFSPMHSWRGRLNDQQMADVIHYIRAIAPSRGIS
jgi:cytochrome c oxidase cbb3-type subunit 3